MTDAGGPNRGRVLHVAEPVDPIGEQLSEVVASAEAELIVVPDVYIGLARLLRSPRPRFTAVVVDLDALEADEFEFFTYLRRQKPGTPVFVYGRDHRESRLSQALAMGARALDDMAALRAMLESVALDRGTGEMISKTETAKSSPKPETAPAAPSRSNTRNNDRPESDDGIGAAPTVANDDAQSAPEGRVPTPWSPAPNRPVRQPPKRAEDAPDEAGDAGNPNDDRPLLTDDELTALLGPEDRAAGENEGPS